ncbi:ABC transporter substrate-binding protein [Streptosporangium saharense]|uniref:ABC transporter substrate-binding protein n=1 Tax=Streptosporangium saharense TaxID=1706840 RepID=UPI0036AAB620
MSLAKPAESVVVIGGGSVDTLFEMGVGDRVVGVVGVHAKPAEKYRGQLGELPDIGDALPGREALLALQPDLVIAEQGRTLSGDGGTPTTEQLEEAGIAVYIANSGCEKNSATNKVSDVFGEIKNMGALLGVSDGAKTLNERLRKVLDDVAKRVDGRKPVKVAGVTLIGSDLWVNTGGLDVDIAELAGGSNSLFDDPSEEFKILSKEEITAANPEAILFFPSTTTNDPVGFVRQTFPTTDAVKNDRVLIVNPDTAARTGVRPVYEVEEFARFLHPEAFKQG